MECEGRAWTPLVLEGKKSRNLKQILQENYEQFLHYIQKLGLEIENHGKTTNFQNSSTIVLTMKTTCFKVDFNDKLVTISAIINK